MKHYLCQISPRSPDGDNALRGSKLTTANEPFDFLAPTVEYAMAYVMDILPYFETRLWDHIGYGTWSVSRNGIRLSMTESPVEAMSAQAKLRYFPHLVAYLETLLPLRHLVNGDCIENIVTAEDFPHDRSETSC